MFHPLRDSKSCLRRTRNPLLGISRLIASLRGFEVGPRTRPSDFSEETLSTGVEPTNVRLSKKVPNVITVSLWTPEHL